ncbi:MAG TPA: hypothetical protein VL358_15455 [Caulobacteraceae bacterium]|jgi:hypothetical protein|nr:hypothetical protein [Caulobacteraceae bacterium]
MSLDPGSTTSFVLQLSIAASGVGAFIGGYALMRPGGGKALTGMGFDPGEPAAARTLGGAMLLGHAAALATLAQTPGIGSCMAAGLGSAWFGAAAGRAISAVVDRRRNAEVLLRIGLEALMGVLLWAPLWGYLRLLRHAARGEI